MGLATKKSLKVFYVHLLTELGVADSFEGIGTCFVPLLLLGPLLLHLLAVLRARLLFFKPGGVVLDPNVLLQLAFLLIENELVDFL